MIEHHTSPETDPRGPRPWIAVLLSLVAQGAGHLYVGRWRKGLILWLVGIAFLSAVLWLGLASTFAGMLLLVAAGLLYTVGVAVSAAVDARRARGTKPWRYRWPAVVAVLVCQMVVGSGPLDPRAHVRAFKVPSGSMEPALRVGDLLIADIKAWSRRDPERGDLVIHRLPGDPERMFIKRVIALPGETIEIRDKRVSIDGEPIDDPWATHSDDRTYSDSRFYPEMVRRRDQFGPLVVPDGTVFLLGDNRDNSNDSRYHGPIDRSLLVSRPLYLYWSSDSSRIGRSLSRE
jgi:signal peptidase I